MLQIYNHGEILVRHEKKNAQCNRCSVWIYWWILSGGNGKHVSLTGKTCLILPPPINGKVAFSCGYSFGSRATLACNKGFRIVGSRHRFCKDGLWSGNMTTCKSKLLYSVWIKLVRLLSKVTGITNSKSREVETFSVVAIWIKTGG